MEKDNEVQIVSGNLARIKAFETSIQLLNAPLAEYLGGIGLPTENVLMPVDERTFVIRALESTINILPIEEREKAFYLSKFAVSASVGLFDAALNYLWNETISALRRLAASIDLSYFFDVAEKRESYRQKLQGPDDLEQIGDHDLITTCARVGLINEVNRERLLHVNYMRNHASAAHPNQNDLSGAELVAWLKNCLRYAITATPDATALEIQRLLHNLRSKAIPGEDVLLIGGELRKLPQEKIDDFLWTIFGNYADTSSSQITKQNILRIASHAWIASTENRKYEVGARYAYFAKHGDQERKKLANDFLKQVDGLRYRSEEVLVAELLEGLRALRSAHFGDNNFYNEWPHAAALEKSLPPSGKVYRPVRNEWVKVIVQAFAGNGKGFRDGTDESAVEYYKKYIGNFGDEEIIEFIRLFQDQDFTVDFGYTKPDLRVRKLSEWFKTRTTDVFILRALDAVIRMPQGKLQKVAATTEYQDCLDNLPEV